MKRKKIKELEGRVLDLERGVNDFIRRESNNTNEVHLVKEQYEYGATKRCRWDCKNDDYEDVWVLSLPVENAIYAILDFLDLDIKHEYTDRYTTIAKKREKEK